MELKSARRYALAILFIINLMVFGLAACGAPAVSTPLPVAQPTSVPTPLPEKVLPPAIPEMRMLTLEYPAKIRAGDSDVVRLTLELDENGNLTPTVSAAGNVISGQVVVIPNLYETHNVLAEARLDMAGIDVRPAETISETLLPGQKVTFYWSLLPAEIGNYKGTVWFYLHFIPKAGGLESRQAISAQPVEIEATSFFGLGARSARWLGAIGSLLSSVLGLPFLEAILKWLWKRLRH